ncbi:hypothetical protein [Brucella pseudintermedia]|uniref:hypothetical protein n=1 Tax=Brucella pseudintermedia TaxID=370111 RepID=UPI00124C9CAD|nr:hypothetical protein [Brucella pseudintermedia]KAB2680921.1 hypothetical protein F9K78_15030 [Brucella pseudintermedia]
MRMLRPQQLLAHDRRGLDRQAGHFLRQIIEQRLVMQGVERVVQTDAFMQLVRCPLCRLIEVLVALVQTARHAAAGRQMVYDEPKSFLLGQEPSA